LLDNAHVRPFNYPFPTTRYQGGKRTIIDWIWQNLVELNFDSVLDVFAAPALYLRTAVVERSFGNKTTWDTPFEVHFHAFVREANRAVFNNQRNNRALNLDAFETPTGSDHQSSSSPQTAYPRCCTVKKVRLGPQS
jgi:hypothetical protein